MISFSNNNEAEHHEFDYVELDNLLEGFPFVKKVEGKEIWYLIKSGHDSNSETLVTCWGQRMSEDVILTITVYRYVLLLSDVDPNEIKKKICLLNQFNIMGVINPVATRWSYNENSSEVKFSFSALTTFKDPNSKEDQMTFRSFLDTVLQIHSTYSELFSKKKFWKSLESSSDQTKEDE